MKTIVSELPKEQKVIELHALADLHIGDRNSDMGMIKAMIQSIADKPNAYAVLNGDILNWASKTSVSDCYAEVYTPMQQIEIYSKLFEPIKDKILAIVDGNHEGRTYRTEGIQLGKIIANQMGIPERYSAETALLFIRFGNNWRNKPMCYTVFMNHGSGGGRKEGAKAIRLADMASIIDADVYVHSHTHLPMVMKQAFYRVNYGNNSASLSEKLFVNTGSALNYGGYGERYEFKPNSKANPIIYLDGTRREMNARI